MRRRARGAGKYFIQNAELDAYVAELSARPGDAYLKAADALITGWKGIGTFSGLETLLFLNFPTTEAALIDVINPTTVSFSENGTMTHTPGQGYAGDAASGYLLSSNPFVTGGLSRDDSRSGAYVRDVGTTTGRLFGTRDFGSERMWIGISDASNMIYNINSPGGPSVAHAISAGVYETYRDGQTSQGLRRNGTGIDSDSTVAAGSGASDNGYSLFAQADYQSGFAIGNFSDCQESLYYKGTHVSEADAQSEAALIATFVAACEAAAA